MVLMISAAVHATEFRFRVTIPDVVGVVVDGNAGLPFAGKTLVLEVTGDTSAYQAEFPDRTRVMGPFRLEVSDIGSGTLDGIFDASSASGDFGLVNRLAMVTTYVQGVTGNAQALTGYTFDNALRASAAVAQTINTLMPDSRITFARADGKLVTVISPRDSAATVQVVVGALTGGPQVPIPTLGLAGLGTLIVAVALGSTLAIKLRGEC
ncbi:MAG: hypothetical protein U1F10_11965 [Burkholderiales bacterium]